ncbi:MAG: hypothetical protein GY816_21055 [Cytophagales bacterium]|nr:hypothetical protein [Cytophagales bacterium]
MNNENHYKILLELDSTWKVASIDFDHEKESILVKLLYRSDDYCDPLSGEHHQI